ncbi:MAG: cupin domain-containing protein [Ardenticatenaceae bacterium]|nr:cupin domain-containing protein [Ardenticatenaceae bacterium]HBY93297.1 cupin [Chloroflexota bacterium]
MSKLQAVQKDALTEAASSPGITRDLAFKGEGLVVLRSRVDPGTVSGWHHHGDYTVYGYVVSGTARLESGPGGRDAITVGPGGFFSVPPHTVHREMNPSATEGGEVILFLQGTGPTVVNVEGRDST